MRVATANSYDNTIAQLTKRQAELSALQGQIATGKRVQKASDDPVAAVLSEAAQNRLTRVQADQRALEASKTSIVQGESALGQAGEILQSVRDQLISAGNGSYGPREFKDIALQIEGMRDELLSVANQKNSSGRTLFGGLGGAETPFIDSFGPGGSAVTFQGLRGQEATGDNSLPQSFDGNAVFMRIPQGNGTFVLGQSPGNTGSVRTDTGQVLNPSALTGQNYSISFADNAGTMEYSVTNTTTGLPVAGQTGMPYASGTAIAFDGLSFSVDGNPQTGDSITLDASAAPTDIFKVLQNVVDALRSATTNNSPELMQALGRTTAELDSGHDRILQARSMAGAWLNRADSIETLLTDRAVAHQTEQSNLEDLDMVQGISDFQNQQTGLQAALQSYAQVQRLSLFQYIG
jgi:flagellar hook-associated protein 3 FlgL